MRSRHTIAHKAFISLHMRAGRTFGGVISTASGPRDRAIPSGPGWGWGLDSLWPKLLGYERVGPHRHHWRSVDPAGEVTAATRLRLTADGRRVLGGEADHVRLNGVDRWVGGVHLAGPGSPWRWDEGTESIVTLPDR